MASAVQEFEINANNLELLVDLLESDGDFEENINKMINEVFI